MGEVRVEVGLLLLKGYKTKGLDAGQAKEFVVVTQGLTDDGGLEETVRLDFVERRFEEGLFF